MTGLSAMTKIVGEAKADYHAGGMTQRPKQEAVAAEPNSATGQYLKPLLIRSSRATSRDADEAGGQPVKKARRKAPVSSKNQPDLIAAK